MRLWRRLRAEAAKHCRLVRARLRVRFRFRVRVTVRVS
jgi:hypothetical protein